MRWQLTLTLAGLVIGLPCVSHPAAAAEKAAKKPAPVARTTTAAPAPTAPQTIASPGGLSIPDGPRLRLLIYTTLIAINQANQTGNYSVLRDLAAPGFREANDSAKLAEIFANLRHRDIDLSPTIFIEPRLVRPPALMPNGMLRFNGYIPSAPEQVNFDLTFQSVNGKWLLFAIGVNTSPAAAVNLQPGAGNPAAQGSGASASDTSTQSTGKNP